tara:strand:+ start:733 stop:861 length:129 start_codon:yes stop_codon:yes gene_type:complete
MNPETRGLLQNLILHLVGFVSNKLQRRYSSDDYVNDAIDLAS